MHYRRLGRSGLKVSEISLGAYVTFGNQIDEPSATNLIQAAFDQGVNFFDNVDINANGQGEIIVGKAIRDLPRDALVLSSKTFWPTSPYPNGRGLSRKHLTEALHASLRRMGVEYLDLYYCGRFDPDTPIDEVVFTMNDLIRQGKILYWGTSEWESSQIALACGVARQANLQAPTMEQPQYNLFHRRRVEIELAPLCRELGLGLTTFAPLYNGILSGKYNQGIPEGSRASLDDYAWIRAEITPERLLMVRELTALAEELELTTAQLALAWVLRRKEVSSVITGATRLKQLDENLVAADAVGKLTDEVLEEIELIVDNLPE